MDAGAAVGAGALVRAAVAVGAGFATGALVAGPVAGGALGVGAAGAQATASSRLAPIASIAHRLALATAAMVGCPGPCCQLPRAVGPPALQPLPYGADGQERLVGRSRTSRS